MQARDDPLSISSAAGIDASLALTVNTAVAATATDGLHLDNGATPTAISAPPLAPTTKPNIGSISSTTSPFAPSNNPPTGTPSAESLKDKPHGTKSAIVGGAAGSVIALIVLGVVVWLLLRAKRLQRSRKPVGFTDTCQQFMPLGSPKSSKSAFRRLTQSLRGFHTRKSRRENEGTSGGGDPLLEVRTTHNHAIPGHAITASIFSAITPPPDYTSDRWSHYNRTSPPLSNWPRNTNSESAERDTISSGGTIVGNGADSTLSWVTPPPEYRSRHGSHGPGRDSGDVLSAPVVRLKN